MSTVDFARANTIPNLMPEPPIRWCEPDELRGMFNDGGVWERALAGELAQTVQKERHPSPPRAGEPHCTRSQIITYHDHNGVRVALVHQYLRPDGALGGSGKPDPKELLVEGVLYRARTRPQSGV